MPDVVDLAACAGVPIEQVGGKARGLGRLLEHALDVPSGFVVTTDAYRRWIDAHGFAEQIGRLVSGADDVVATHAAAREVEKLLTAAGLQSEEIDRAYAQLDRVANPPVAVRSSATAEDGAEASFAGQQDTHLWIRGADAVRRHIVGCWASLFTAPAIVYRKRLGLRSDQVQMAVVVQRMVPAHAAGVMFTIDPLTGDPSQITIEATVGLGQPLVGGEITPDRYCVDKVTFEIRSRTIATKPFADRQTDDGGVITRVELSADEARASSLTDEEIRRLAQIAKRVESWFGGAVDIEWALGEGPDGARHPYLLQARPETVWTTRERTGATAADRADPRPSLISRIATTMRKPDQPNTGDRT
ncbi:MAG: PEP/pyruvate-binding domain-containing protein [Solirubrobacteraceae bacterium]